MAALDKPILLESQRVTTDWTVLPSFLPVPGLGVLAVNSFLLKSREPMLVDTGLAAVGEVYVEALEREIELRDLRWIWLSHVDADHVGNLQRLLDRAPRARIVTNFLGMGKMGLAGMDVSRVDLLEPGARLEVGGHTCVPLRPPYYDAPETIGFIDTTDRVFFAADSFGALLPEPALEAAELSEPVLREGLRIWSTIDAPWLATTDRATFAGTLHALRRLEPRIVLSSHLPASREGVGRLADIVHEAWCSARSTETDPLAIEAVAAALVSASVPADAMAPAAQEILMRAAPASE